MSSSVTAINADSRPYVPYVAPFAIFMLFTEMGRWLPEWAPWLYAVKTILAGGLILYWRESFAQDLRPRLEAIQAIEAVACGILVLAIWILADGYLFKLDVKNGFAPHAMGSEMAAVNALLGIRLLGSSFVVPIMEELFWRSFLMRWLIKPDFKAVPLGAFTWFSFLATALLFGLEHNRIVSGIVAGLIYGLLLVRQRNLKGVILAHMVTNLGLAIHVITTGSWQFW